jgi:hypothetical protein
LLEKNKLEDTTLRAETVCHARKMDEKVYFKSENNYMTMRNRHFEEEIVIYV